MRRRIALSVGLMMGSGMLSGQGVINIDTIMPASQGRWALPAGWLLPHSVVFEPAVVWRYDSTAHALEWKSDEAKVRIKAKIVSLPRAEPRFKPLPWTAIEKWDSLTQSSRRPPPPFSSTTTDTFVPQINRSGSLIRSLTIGTGQNATLNSAFRLTLEGKVAPDLYVIAALTDENLPFQTAATQSLTDFDRINIGLRWRNAKLLLGDLELRESRTYFANFYRNVLGIQLHIPAGKHEMQAAFAEAKGQFHTNSFMGQEGRQGPYPLTGKNGERFIPILAGSEKVYVNGVLMQRGQDRDYVIDYTVGEITFMPRVPITAATRIVVDFEYADRSYGRGFIWLGERWQSEKASMGVAYFRQADNFRRPLDFTLSPAEERLLAALPPGSQQGLLPGVDTLPYEAGAIRYAARDTVIEGQPYQYFIVSQDPQEARYQLSFVFVGAGQGEYIREPSSLNGNVFRWVGIGRGEYIIGRAIPLPRSIEVLSLQYSWQTLKRLMIEGEIDGSRYVENRFAGRSIQDIALRQRIRWQAALDTVRWWLSPEITFQYVGASYQNADRIYAREYGRYWNYNDLSARQTERLIEGHLTVGYRKRYRFTPNAGWRSWGDSLTTLRTAILWEGTDTTRGIGGTYLAEYIPSYAQGRADRWLRQTGRLFYTYKAWQIGTILWTERRSSELLDTANFRFYEYTPFIRYEADQWSWRIAYQWRYERQSLRGDSTFTLKPRFRAFMPQVEIRYQGQRLGFSTITTYRWFIPGDAAFGLLPSRNFLSQNSLRLRWRPWEMETFYQLSSEQTPQRQILFVAVNPGQGTHEWRDLNGDNLQQIEEFFPAVNPLLANYIRVQRATGRFIPTVALSAAASLRWQPEMHLRWLSYQANARLEQRQNAPDTRLKRYLPSPPPADSSFLQWTFAHRQDLFLWRQAVKGDQTFSFQYQLSQTIPLSGLQRQEQRQYSSRTRYNFSRRLGSEILLLHMEKSSLAPAQPEMTYTYKGEDMYPQIIYQPSARWRTAIGIAYRQRRGKGNGEFRIKGMRLPMEQRWSWKAGALLSLRLEPAFYRANTAVPPSLLLFDLLEGMQIGRNLFIGLTLNFPVSRFVELSLLYEGRLSEREPIHSARMQARANF